VGDLETDAHLCHHICASVPCCVIDINYRLVPEYPFPIGIMDALSAVKFIIASTKIFSIDSSRMTLGGQSTGGTIALVLNHLLRDAGMGGVIKGVVVGTPSITGLKQIATAHQSPYPSMQDAEFAPLLNWPKLKWFETLKWMSLSADPGATKKDVQKDVSWFSDLLSAPNFGDLAPLTWIGTADVDPLRDEGEAYAEKLRESGSNVIHRRFLGVPHLFMHMDRALEQGRDYVNDVILHIRQCLLNP
jgi:acetyl esterase/lipase